MNTSSAPDAATVIVWTERATAALNLARQYRAQANAVSETPDPHGDVLAGDMRREVARLIDRAADRYESYADDCRERALNAQEIRRHRYDDVDVPA